jgi:hypothetical protein
MLSGAERRPAWQQGGVVKVRMIVAASVEMALCKWAVAGIF